jgi:hypothetical protein
LVVKGAGHSYPHLQCAGFAIGLDPSDEQVTLHDAFSGAGKFNLSLRSARVGCSLIDLYNTLVTPQAGRYVQGGGCADVGVRPDSKRRLQAERFRIGGRKFIGASDHC